MKRMLSGVLAAALLTGTLLVTGCGPGGEGDGRVETKGDAFVLSDGTISMTVGKDGTVRETALGGTVFQKDGKEPLIQLLQSRTPDMWESRSWFTLSPGSVTAKKKGNRIQITAKDFSDEAITGDATVIMDIAIRGDEFVFETEVKNDGDNVVIAVDTPRIGGFVDLQDSRMIVPNRAGQIVSDPFASFATVYKAKYPVPMSSQFFTYESRDVSWSLACTDKTMRYKEFDMGGKTSRTGVRQYPFLAKGKSERLSDVRLKVYRGSWHAAADTYSQWFDGISEKPRKSKYVEDRSVLKATVVGWRPAEEAGGNPRSYTGAIGNASKLVAEGAEAIQITGWHGQGHDTDYPEMKISEEFGGPDGLRQLVDSIKQKNVQVGFYSNARLMNINNEMAMANPDWKILPAKSENPTESYGAEAFSIACPGSGFAEHYINRLVDMTQNYSADFFQLDQIGAAESYLCFDKTHTHSTPATAWNEGYISMLKTIDAKTSAINPDVWFWIEGAWEGAGQIVQVNWGTEMTTWGCARNAVHFPQYFRYTYPYQNLMTQSYYNGLPGNVGGGDWWEGCKSQAIKIQKQYLDFFKTSAYMDDNGLTADSADYEAVWHKSENALLLTARKGVAADGGTVRLTLDHAFLQGKTVASAVWLTDGAEADVTIEDGRIVLTVELPASQKTRINGVYVTLK